MKKIYVALVLLFAIFGCMILYLNPSITPNLSGLYLKVEYFFSPPSTESLLTEFIDAEYSQENMDLDAQKYEVCGKLFTKIKGQEHVILSVCRSLKNQDEAAQNEPGYVDLFVLRRDQNVLNIAAYQMDVASGAFGQAWEGNIVRLGESFYGFELASSGNYQAHLLSESRIYAPQGGTIKQVLALSTLHNNENTCEEPCDTYNIERNYKIDNGNKAMKVYPINVIEMSHRGKKSISNKFTLHFNYRTWQYEPPKGYDLQIN